MTMLDLCYDSLDGLSVGDALGAQFLVPGTSLAALLDGDPPAGPWPWTDDTEMACSIVAELRERDGINQDSLAARFAERFEPYRGYGAGAVVLLRQVRQGVAWRDAAGAAFDGQGSMGNGAAMRVAPLGAFHAGDNRTAARQAWRSAEVTHAHPEAILGAVAVAVAAAEAGWSRLTRSRPEPAELLDVVLAHLIDGRLMSGIVRARRLLGVGVAEAAYELGNGAQVLAFDTVPFALWVAATRLDDYPAAIHACVEAGGDVDTTAAIVGGIVAAYTGSGPGGVPAQWLARREPLPDDVRPTR
ncbi:ADP-ribosylglycohydrolase family protein [Solwaraspora sp. WMMD792]|uniref:ADP-ribosylglycohydrolase family protein n=1 Tax=Solwaraspora sp. WMMD792 TaxID=3016099 RepID=UPI002417ADA7|nr:ADP-ribosylglycohydrolase family protein [Solwaraspora sp. WMMD792]MDG4775194.1 ADP-ribosylglycohydrolase family protein [Solwaraspora sp. WMMD792]